MKFSLGKIFFSSFSKIISASVLLEKISLFSLIFLSSCNFLKIAIKGVIPAPPAIKIPSPLYSIVPKTSFIFNFSPACNS